MSHSPCADVTRSRNVVMDLNTIIAFFSWMSTNEAIMFLIGQIWSTATVSDFDKLISGPLANFSISLNCTPEHITYETIRPIFVADLKTPMLGCSH